MASKLFVFLFLAIVFIGAWLLAGQLTKIKAEVNTSQANVQRHVEATEIGTIGGYSAFQITDKAGNKWLVFNGAAVPLKDK